MKSYKCRKCGDIFPNNKDYKHYYICQDTDTIDPEDVFDSFKRL